MSKYFKIAAIVTLILIAAYLTLLFIQPSYIVQKVFLLKFNNPGRVDSAAYKDIRFLIFASAISAFFIWLLESKYQQSIVDLVASLLKKVSAAFTINVLLGISLVYLTALFYTAITHYDLGYDEAWVIHYAKNFASTSMSFTENNGKIVFIDVISMLPYLILSLVNFKAGLTGVADFKFLSVLLTAVTLFIIYRVTAKFYNRKVAIVSIFVLIIQPGFGFMASSFFGEITEAAFLMCGLFIWLRSPQPPDTKRFLQAAVLFALAIHTKFQVAPILALCLIILHFTNRESGALKALLYTVVATAAIIFIRIIPILIYDPKLTVNLLKMGFTETPGFSPVFLLDKIQLYNRFFPFSILLLSLGVFFFYMKSALDRFLFLFASITSFWWIFLYPYSTYRNPFMGLIPLSIIIAILLVRSFEMAETKKPITTRYAAAIIVALCMTYGFSANIIYAYVGYNDGVQFDLDGYRSRLFSLPVEDTSQKEFYGELGRMVSRSDTLYNGTFVTQFYLDNAVADLPNLTESIRTNPGRKFLLITRDRYPLDMEKGRHLLDSLHATWRLGLKNGDYEMYELMK